MTAPTLNLVVPGALDQRTGGYLYDARMVEGLRARRWRVDVHSLDGRFPLADDVARTSLENTFTQIPNGARVVVDGLALAAAVGALERHRHRLEVLALVHHPLSDETGLDPATRTRLVELESEVLQAVRGVVVTSAFTARGLVRFGVDGHRVRIVTPGTDAASLAPSPPPDAPLQMLVVASLIPRKGHEVLVRALGRLREQTWHCVCAGSLERDVRYADGIIAMAEAAGLSDRMTFVGECDDGTLDRLYAGASLFVLPSYYEGYGMVLTEALARGLPIVSTTGGAIPDTVPAEVGLLVPPGDDEALSDAVGSLIGGGPAATLRSRFAAAARRHAATIRSWETAVEAMAEALVSLAPAPAATREAAW